MKKGSINDIKKIKVTYEEPEKEQAGVAAQTPQTPQAEQPPVQVYYVSENNGTVNVLKNILITVIFSVLGAYAGGYVYNKYYNNNHIYTIDASLIYSLGFKKQQIEQATEQYPGVVIDKTVLLNKPPHVHDITQQVLQTLKEMLYEKQQKLQEKLQKEKEEINSNGK